MLLLIRSLCTPCLDYEEFLEEGYGAYHADEVYYEEPDLSGGVEGVNYMLAYGADDVNEEELEA